jgi:hypothetical protein
MAAIRPADSRYCWQSIGQASAPCHRMRVRCTDSLILGRHSLTHVYQLPGISPGNCRRQIAILRGNSVGRRWGDSGRDAHGRPLLSVRATESASAHAGAAVSGCEAADVRHLPTPGSLREPKPERARAACHPGPGSRLCEDQVIAGADMPCGTAERSSRLMPPGMTGWICGAAGCPSTRGATQSTRHPAPVMTG